MIRFRPNPSAGFVLLGDRRKLYAQTQCGLKIAYTTDGYGVCW